ncbi:hypothetical protein HMPREF2660_05790 [Weeksella sp. HMSC059D05]|nr:hypothetical protein HMPREF2660_05790 [Weeksella sp. HMSC059D05]
MSIKLKIMKKIYVLSVASLLFASCQSNIDGEGPSNQKIVSKNVETIQSLEANCNCELTLIPGTENKVEVESHQNILDNFTIEAKGKTLLLSEKIPVDKYNNYQVFVYVTRDFKNLEIKGLTSAKVVGTLNADNLAISLKDQAKLSEIYLITNDFDLKAQNQTQVDLRGTAVNLNLKAYDQANLNLTNFEVNDTKFVVENNAQIIINSRNSLVGDAKGTAVVEYIGNPRKDTKIADQAQVIKK